MEQRRDCTNAFKDAFNRIGALENGSAKADTLIEVHTKTLDIISKRLEAIATQGTETATILKYLEKAEKKRNGVDDKK